MKFLAEPVLFALRRSVSIKALVALAYETLHEASAAHLSTLSSSGPTPASTSSAPCSASGPPASSKAKTRPPAGPKGGSEGSLSPPGGAQGPPGGATPVLLGVDCIVQLFYCVRSMFELYVSMAPVCHRDQLTTLPLFAGTCHVVHLSVTV